MHKRLLCFLFLLISLAADSQGIPTFERYLGAYYTQTATDVVRFPNKKMLFTAYASRFGAVYPGLLLNTDENAKTYWVKEYRVPSSPLRFEKLIASGSAAYVLGSGNSVFLSKVDSNGTVLWAKKYNRTSSAPKATSMIQTFDNNLMITACDSFKTLLVKCDTFGNVLWSRHFYVDSGWPTSSASTIQLADRSLITISTVSAYVPANGETQPHGLILKTDENGSIIWSKKIYYNISPFVFAQDLYVFGRTIFHTSDGGYVATFYEGMWGFFGGGAIATMKLDSAGNILFASEPNIQASIMVASEYPTGTLNMVQLGGTTGDVMSPIHPVLFKTDLSLSPLQATQYRQPKTAPGYSDHHFAFETVKQLPDKRFVFVGATEHIQREGFQGISLLFTNTAGDEDCTSLPSVFGFWPDTTMMSAPVTLQQDTGIVAAAVSMTDSLVFLRNCNCDSLPVANFGYTVSGNTVTFSDSSLNATEYEWGFGDNTKDTVRNPVHTYADSVQHTVYLIVTNNCGYEAKVVAIDTTSPPVAVKNLSAGSSNKFTLYPNPANERVYLVPPPDKNTEVSVSNILGQEVLRAKYDAGITVANFKSGIYFLQAHQNGQLQTKMFVISHPENN